MPWKNSTLDTDPSLSDAVADIVTEEPVAKLVLLDGPVIDTAGATLAGACTVMLTAPEVVTAPRLSVALAVREWLPAAADAHAKL